MTFIALTRAALALVVTRTLSTRFSAPIFFAVLAFSVLALPNAAAAPGLVHPELEQARGKLERARGPARYTALRRVWSMWDRADPLHVEALLRAASTDRGLNPAERVYAGMLAAYARLRRGDVATAKREIAELGFVDRWLVVGPFDNDGKAGLSNAFGPELEFAQAIIPGRAYTGKERPVRFREAPPAFPYGFLNTGALMRPERQICVYATSFVSGKADTRLPRPVGLWVGTSGAFRLFWNGREVLSDTAYRGHDADRFSQSVILKPGVNNLTLKLCGDESGPIASLRIADPRGAPDPQVTWSSDVTLSPKAAENASDEADKPAPPASPKGPIQAFEELTKKDAARARDLFDYAEYLALTDGDDPVLHIARDLSRRSAELEPTVERLLLSAELSEDRNQQNEWLTKAEARVKLEPDKAHDVLVARALHRRSGPNWREAAGYFEQALRIDPDSVAAIAGRVELYNHAGLVRTALNMLKDAVDRNPDSVLLLSMYASQLRALSQTTLAEEVEARYAALRHDDSTRLGRLIELAVARRNRVATEHWTQRLLDIDPASQWALTLSARAHRRLGAEGRALAFYERALELAPDDVGTLRALADLKATLGDRSGQLALLQEILRIRPQDRDVREYIELLEPAKKRADEAYAWKPERYLPLRNAPAKGQNQRSLRDLTVTTVFENGLSSRFRQVVFQPLTQSAAAAATQYSFHYQADRQAVQLRGARIFRGDGSVHQAVESGEAAADDPSISMYTSARNFYVQFPRLEPGDVVELLYRIDDVTPQNEFADYFGDIVYLQSSEPIANAEYVLLTPKTRTVNIDVRHPGLERQVKKTKDQHIYSFFAKEVPAIAPEPSMPPWPEVLGFVHVSTYKTWKDLGTWYWGLIRDQFDLDDETRALARRIAAGKETELDKVKAVYNWVIENTRYVALEFGIYGYKPRRCVQTVARGWGDCKDKATVIVTLLKELGIDSTLVVLRTQMRGDFRSSLPSLAPFDHAIVYVPSLDLYLDGTAEYTGSGELPRMDLEALGLLVNQGDSKLVRLPGSKPEHNRVRRNIVAELSKNGDAELELDYETTGAGASEWRRRYHAEATRRERVNSDLGNEFPGFALSEGNAGLSSSDLSDVEQPVRISIRGTAPGFGRMEGEDLSIEVTPGQRLTPRFASLSTRKQDIRLLAFPTVDDTFVVKLPPGAKVVRTPPPAEGRSPFGSYRVSVDQAPGQVTVKSQIQISATRIRPADYAAWKRFCAEVDRAMNPRLLVRP